MDARYRQDIESAISQQCYRFHTDTTYCIVQVYTDKNRYGFYCTYNPNLDVFEAPTEYGVSTFNSESLFCRGEALAEVIGQAVVGLANMHFRNVK